jgi:hypothetical protein
MSAVLLVLVPLLVLILVSSASALSYTEIAESETYLGSGGDASVFGGYNNTFAGSAAAWKGTFDIGSGGQDAVINEILADWGYSILYSAKQDIGGTATGDFNLTVTSEVFKEPGEAIAGTWSASLDNDPLAIDIFVVKGSTYASFLTGGPSSTGTWNTGYLPYVLTGGPEPQSIPISISYFRALQTESVPEPTTLLLLGLGLVGMAGMRRKLR